MKAESENSGLSEAAPEPGPRGAWRSRAPHSASGFQYSGLTLYIVIDVFSRSCLAESLAPTTVPAPPPPRRGVPSPVPALALRRPSIAIPQPHPSTRASAHTRHATPRGADAVRSALASRLRLVGNLNRIT